MKLKRIGRRRKYTQFEETKLKRNVKRHIENAMSIHTQFSQNVKRRNSNEISRGDTTATCQETKRKQDVKGRD